MNTFNEDSVVNSKKMWAVAMIGALIVHLALMCIVQLFPFSGVRSNGPKTQTTVINLGSRTIKPSKSHGAAPRKNVPENSEEGEE